MALLPQDHGNYKEISSSEQIIRRRHVSFKLEGMTFTDQTGSHKASSDSTYYHYKANFASRNPVSYNEDPKILVDDLKARDQLAYQVAEMYLLAMYENVKIVDLKATGDMVRFSGGRNQLKQFSLDLTVEVNFDQVFESKK